PRVFTSCPLFSATASRSTRKYVRSSSPAPSSPKRWKSSVEPTRSVNSSVRSALFITCRSEAATFTVLPLRRCPTSGARVTRVHVPPVLSRAQPPGERRQDLSADRWEPIEHAEELTRIEDVQHHRAARDDGCRTRLSIDER